MTSRTPGVAVVAEKPPTHRDVWKPNPNPKAPDFAEGNMAAVKSGAFSPRLVNAKAADLEPEFSEWLVDRAPWAAADEFELTRTNYLRTRAVVELLYADIIETAARLGTAKVPTRRFETLLSALRGELVALGQLGLTPPTKAQLAQTVVSTEHTLGDLMAQGRQIRKAAEARHAAQALKAGHDTITATEGDK
jgi:hypothetical protein